MKKTVKKVVLWTIASVCILFVVLCVHIYVVMMPKAPGAHTIAMARIDFRQDITTADAATITSWLYQQNGVDHVLCNPATKIAVFSYHPANANADNIVNQLTSNFHYKAGRFIPSEKDMTSGCPVAGTSFTYRIYDFMSKIL